MECLPAIDIRGGRCVRLLRGDFASETVYGDPLLQAQAFVAAGAKALHVVDLDAARGSGENGALVASLIAGTGVPVQVGGGIRDEERALRLLSAGARRVVLGTLAVEEPERVAALAVAHPGQIAIGLDHREGEVALRGWAVGGGKRLGEVLAAYAGVPLGAVVVTPIERDGTLAGPDLDGYAALLSESALPLVASGGIATLGELRALAALEGGGRRLAGAVIGRALLSGAFDVAEAVAACVP
jgi:phosphoribosylformimino-5-aminoimidazole carboxamide ribotide isomerase